MVQKQQNIHDEFFKRNFSVEQVARDFLAYNLPKDLLEQVNLSTVKVENNEFTSSLHQGARRADVLYSVKQKRSSGKVYALVHLEGQSTHHKEMALRVWQYHVAIASKLIQQENFQKLPIIVTYVLYHGKEAWSSEKSVAELWEEEAFDEYIKKGLKATFLRNLRSTPAEFLLSQKSASAPQYILHKQQEGEFCSDLKSLYNAMKKYEQDTIYNLNYMSTLDRHKHEVFLEKICKLDPSKAREMQVLFENEIREAREEAMLVARKEAKKERLKALREVARKLLKKGMSISDVVESVGLGIKEVQHLSKN